MYALYSRGLRGRRWRCRRSVCVHSFACKRWSNFLSSYNDCDHHVGIYWKVRPESREITGALVSRAWRAEIRLPGIVVIFLPIVYFRHQCSCSRPFPIIARLTSRGIHRRALRASALAKTRSSCPAVTLSGKPHLRVAGAYTS